MIARAKRPRIELLLVSASLLASLAVAEVALRFFPKFDPLPQAEVGSESDHSRAKYLVPDPELGWRMPPSAEFPHETAEFSVIYRSNALGFRDGQHSSASPSQRRIAIVGDSFSFGWGVSFDETFGALVEQSLPGTAVQNFALPGYAIDQMWLTEREIAMPMKPDLLILAFISDDFTRSLTAHRYNMGLNKPAFELEGDTLRRKTPEDAPAAWLWYVANHSRLWAGVRQMMRLVGHRYPIGEWWRLNRAMIDEIRADCHAAHTRLLVVYLFTREPRPFPALTAYLQETSTDFVDLGNRPPPSTHALTYSGDAHPNPDGHRYIADEILTWIDRDMPTLKGSPSLAR